ncbi:MAG TPA: response regulator [Thermoanaerobaculia bacterium]|nr:response regulator [Thermoanaerobaculia bacterium]
MTPKSVLIVDDDPAFRQLMGVVLADEAYSLAFAAGGREALEMTGAKRYDAIVLDLKMPDVSGFDVLEGLKQSAPGIANVIVMSAGSDGLIESTLTPNVIARIRKPFEISKLRTALSDCLSARSAVPPPHKLH